LGGGSTWAGRVGGVWAGHWEVRRADGRAEEGTDSQVGCLYSRGTIRVLALLLDSGALRGVLLM